MDFGSTPTSVCFRQTHDNSRISGVIGGRLRHLRDFQRQYQRKPAGCQPTTVSGLTTISTLFQLDQNCRSSIQNNRSIEFNDGRGRFLLSTDTVGAGQKSRERVLPLTIGPITNPIPNVSRRAPAEPGINSAYHRLACDPFEFSSLQKSLHRKISGLDEIPSKLRADKDYRSGAKCKPSAVARRVEGNRPVVSFRQRCPTGRTGQEWGHSSTRG